MTDNTRINELVAGRMKRKTPEQLAALEAGRRSDEQFKAAYDRAEAAEKALDAYTGRLPTDERIAFCRDAGKYSAVSRLFFSARDPELLARYSKMAVDDLVAEADSIAARKACGHE